VAAGSLHGRFIVIERTKLRTSLSSDVVQIIQTALIGSLASVGINDRVQAIVTIIVLATTITPPQLLAFAMISMGLDDQVDM